MDFGLSAEQAAFLDRVREFAQTRVAPRASAIDETAAFPADLVKEAAALGLAGKDYVSLAAALEEIAAASATLAVLLVVHYSLVVDPLAEFGTAAQKDAWLGRLSSAEALGAFALSEAQSGSDASHQKTVAVADGDGFRLRGEKVWVTSGSRAEVTLVFAATRPGEGSHGITCFLVPMSAPGVKTSPSPDTLGVRGLG